MQFNSSLLYFRIILQQLTYQVNFLSRNEPNYFGLASCVWTLNPKVRRPILLQVAFVLTCIGLTVGSNLPLQHQSWPQRNDFEKTEEELLIIVLFNTDIKKFNKPEFRGERCRTCPPLHSHPHKKVLIISGRRNKCGNFIESTWTFSFVA